jgi:hypothetical protein
VEGTKVCYCIDADNWARMKAVMLHFLDQDLSSPSCC